MKSILVPILFLALYPRSTQAADANAVLRDMRRVADWQLEHPSRHSITDWTQAPFFLGLFNLHQVSGDDQYLDALVGFGERANWQPGKRLTHADDHAVLQAWLEVYEAQGKPGQLQPTSEHFPMILKALKDRPKASVSGGTFTWCWCDALFMSPAVWCHLSDITGDSKYLEWADREWWTTTDVLYDPTACLYYRDNHFFGKRTPSGRKVFWSRGNGWVVGGLVHMLDRLPADHPSREKYLGLYHDMMHALVQLQNPDGLWRSSLLDSEDDVGESSGTAFFTYAMAWGLNRGLLPAKSFKPAVIKGWTALSDNIQADGMLGYVQKIGDQPGRSGPKSTEVYGSGAFLLAGAEVLRMIDPSKRREGLASFEGVTLPERFLPVEPRVFARFVPERKDDFAWENDLIAFRAYGPALRDSAESQGFDAWFKRVPYPIIDKWYLEARQKLPYGNVTKSYHQDQGEGYDVYKVGDSLGCGGISLWIDGKIHNSETFVAHRILESGPEKTVFELDYASKAGGRVVRETKRFTVVPGQHLFQCESRFSIDGETGPVEVVIGLKPQGKGFEPVFAPDSGILQVWSTVDQLGVGTGIVLDPAAASKMQIHRRGKADQQAVCVARTDETGFIRWFAGFAWEAQGAIATPGQWSDYLETFAGTFLDQPFADASKTLEVHNLPVPD